ncbi:circadian-associated transcriptional repressor [Salarias fasciatus]|uniref:Circadian-associated transcriptional repressor-like n=1 Tax=Salarias fasciatus TaxID=181472 RepID=A0A672J1L2_SALFA|nr:circadian-associated transcriptional repressor-like [Salarias fasciatus]
MSATDSDNSIDWLASDNEENESEREFDCSSEHGKAEASPPPGAPPHLGLSDGGQLRGGGWSQVSGRTETWDRGSATGLCKPQQGGKPNGKNTQQALKRPHGSEEEEEEEECRERQLSASERDWLFSRKCMELQCYIDPLSSILNGLRSGRYKERLSSFQESVAMDRIQRIMGVLQNPCMGGKYIDIILKMEGMLKSWFPNVRVQQQLDVTHTEEATPTKKPKLSPVTIAAAASPVPASDPPAGAKALRVTDLTPPGAYSANNLKWLHTSPICSLTAEQAQAGPRHLLPPRDRDLTQDSAVSSSTDSNTKTDPLPRGPPPPGKINAPYLERLLKSRDSIIPRRGAGTGTGGLMDSSWS